MKATSS